MTTFAKPPRPNGAGSCLFYTLMATTALAAAAYVSPAAAQDPQGGSTGRALDEIVVTAKSGADVVQVGSFRGARAIDTPLTISVIPAEVLEQQQALMLYDALRNTAGVAPAQTTTTVYSNVSIRGIDVENRGNYRLNGSLPIVNLIDLPLEDKVRVEALKGASALYYGFTTPAGIINLTMARPTAEPYAMARVFGNEYGGAGVHLDLGGTMGMFGARINMVRAYVDTGIDYANGERTLFAGAFDFKPTDNLTFNLDFEQIEKSMVEVGVWRYGATIAPTIADPYPRLPLPPLLDPQHNFGQSWADNDAEEQNVLFHADWDITPAWELTFDYGTSDLTRARHFSTWFPVARTGTTTYAALQNAFENGIGSYRISDQTREYSNENTRIQLAGTFDTGPITHEILLGAGENIRDTDNGGTVNYDRPSGAFPGNYDFRAPPIIPYQGHVVSGTNPSQIDDIGYYFFDRVKFGEMFQLLLGARKSDYTETQGGATIFHDDPISFSYGFIYKPRNWISLYATYIEGLESTPAAPLTANNSGQAVPPAESTQYEYGVKIEPRRGLLFQAAYFDIERGSAYVNANNDYVLDGIAHHEGFELSLSGDVTDELSLYISALFLEATQENAAPGLQTTQGLRIDNTPELTWSVAGNYELDALVPGLSINGAVYYIGDRAINPFNQAYIPEYTLVDLGVAYRADIFERPTTFRVNAENVADKKYFSSAGGGILAQGAPGVIKFSIATEF